MLEFDGGQHQALDECVYDQKRTAYLERKGYRVLRFWNNEALENMEGVLGCVEKALISPSPSYASRISTSPARGEVSE